MVRGWWNQLSHDASVSWVRLVYMWRLSSPTKSCMSGEKMGATRTLELTSPGQGRAGQDASTWCASEWSTKILPLSCGDVASFCCFCYLIVKLRALIRSQLDHIVRPYRITQQIRMWVLICSCSWDVEATLYIYYAQQPSLRSSPTWVMVRGTWRRFYIFAYANC